MATLFFSYSHKDEPLRDRLEVGLAMLKRQGVIDAWHDRRITAGSELDHSISEALEQADVVLLLVSPDFLASSYCYDLEMQRALQRHERGEARVIPVILRPCDWKASPLSKLMVTPRDGKPITSWADPDEAFQDVVESIRAAVPARALPIKPMATVVPQPQPVLPRSSNLRLTKTFTESDRDRFLEDCFDYMAKFFEGSLEELHARNPGIETSFRRVDANRFTAVIYRAGKAVARCKIMLGGMFGRGITYSSDDRASDGSCNESLSVEADEQALFLKALGMSHITREHASQHLSFEGASEYYWAMLIEPLQRSM